MSFKLNLNVDNATSFIDKKVLDGVKKDAKSAYQTLVEKNGEGNDFLGWLDLPVDYDKEEFARILAAAKKIQSNSSVLVAIGIG